MSTIVAGFTEIIFDGIEPLPPNEVQWLIDVCTTCPEFVELRAVLNQLPRKPNQALTVADIKFPKFRAMLCKGDE